MQRPIEVQRQASKLDDALADALGPARYGGVWMGDDDRAKVGVVRPGTRSAVLAAAADNLLAGVVDLVPVRHSVGSLRAANKWLADQIIRANTDATSAMVTGYTTAGNSVQVGLPPAIDRLTPGQRAVLDEARQRFGSMLSTYTLAGQSGLDAAECAKSQVLDDADAFVCDEPVRGGIWLGTEVAGNKVDFRTFGFLARDRRDGKLRRASNTMIGAWVR